MKKLFIIPALLLCAACQQKEDFAPTSNDSKVALTICAEQTPDVKTQIDAAGKTYWSVGDAIGVIAENGGTLYNQQFTHSATAAVEKVAFTGQTYAGTQYVYYPYTQNAQLNAETVTVAIAAEQAPTAVSYDGASDILVGQSFEVAQGGAAEANVAFKRLGAILKLSLINVPQQYVSDAVSSVSVTYDDALAGEVKLDYKAGAIKELGANTSKTITASYASATLGSKFDSYMVAIPQTLQTGKNLTVVVKTDKCTIRKEVTLTQDIDLARGEGNTIKVDMSNAVYNEKLYIYFWAWESTQNAQELECIGNGLYEWAGLCPQWQFKFISSKNDYWTGYFRDETAADYWTMKPGNQSECMFNLNDFFARTDAEFRIVVNTNDMTVKVAPKRMFLADWAWATNYATAPEMEEIGFGEFTWTGYIWNDRNMKFTTSNATDQHYWTGYFRDETASDYWTLKTCKYDQEQMFMLNHVGWRSGLYTVTVNTQTMKVKMHLHVWPIGAFGDGWDKGKAKEMTFVDNGILSWTGWVWADCSFKFLVADDNPAGGYPSGYGNSTIQWYGFIRDVNASEYNTLLVNDNLDDQFTLPGLGYTESGNYTITLNMNTMRVTAEPAN